MSPVPAHYLQDSKAEFLSPVGPAWVLGASRGRSPLLRVNTSSWCWGGGCEVTLYDINKVLISNLK